MLSQLPKKTEHIERCSMLPDQQTVYDGLLTRYCAAISEDSEDTKGGVGIFMQFRKAANHPMLLRHLYDNDKIQKMAKKIAKVHCSYAINCLKCVLRNKDNIGRC